MNKDFANGLITGLVANGQLQNAQLLSHNVLFMSNNTRHTLVSVPDGVAVQAPTRPQAEGLRFNGWLNPVGHGVGFPYTPTSDETFTASYSNSLEFYAPLDSFSTTAETGQEMHWFLPDYSYVFSVDSGVPSCLVPYTSGIGTGGYTAFLLNSIGLNEPLSFSCWVRLTNTISTPGDTVSIAAAGAVSISAIGGNDHDYLQVTYTVAGGTQSFNVNIQNTTVWHHIAVTYDGSTVKIYDNGSLITTDENIALYYPTSSVSADNSRVLGVSTRVAAMRVYSSTLSSSEVATLANEFIVEEG